MSNQKNKMDGSPAFKVIDGDNNVLLRIFHGDRREEMLNEYRNCGKYGSVSEDVDGDIICFEDSEPDDDEY